MSRQNYYKQRRERALAEVNEGLVKELVQAERGLQPRVGGQKLHRMLQVRLKQQGVKLGRDRFFGVLKRQGLLLEPLAKGPRTTCSGHSLPVFGNLVKGKVVERPNEVWVSDITYVRTREGFGYLSLITDMGSRKIVGYHLGRSLETHEAVKALEMALREKRSGARPIHHSDRGSQYCSHEYVAVLRAHGLGISMTEEQHCAENALAERVNGILKQEYYLRDEFGTMEQAQRAVAEAVWLYNTRRLHRSLNYRTPEQVHQAAA
jgi:putative transposase